MFQLGITELALLLTNLGLAVILIYLTFAPKRVPVVVVAEDGSRRRQPRR